MYWEIVTNKTKNILVKKRDDKDFELELYKVAKKHGFRVQEISDTHAIMKITAGKSEMWNESS